MLLVNSPSVDLTGSLIGAMVAVFVALIGNGLLVWRAYWEARERRRLEILVRTLELQHRRLSEFYAPLRALLHSNTTMFKAYGPSSWPEDEYLRDDAAKLWTFHVENSVKPTNKQICEIILHHSDLIHPEDDYTIYTEFIVHAKSFECFRQLPNERHGLVGTYPSSILSQVDIFCSKLKDDAFRTENQIEGTTNGR